QSVLIDLQKLQQLEIVSYLPQTDRPQLTFLQARSDTTNMQIDHQYLRERKHVMGKQIQSVFSYLETTKCRSTLLLTYFDDTEAEDCGICDNCLKSNKRKDKSDELSDIKNEINFILSNGPQDLQQIINRIANGEEEKRIEVLRQLVDA